MNILVTGTAGFIGFHLTKRLLDDGHTVLGLADREGMERLFSEHSFDRVVNLAAQAGVRYSTIKSWHSQDFIT